MLASLFFFCVPLYQNSTNKILSDVISCDLNCPNFASFTLKNNEQINNNFRREVGKMRRMFRLSDASHKDIDLREYEDEILEIADRIIPGKNPKVYQNYFMTDELTQGERVRLGRELSKSPRLKQYGKEVTSFRLFEGRSVEQKMLFT